MSPEPFTDNWLLAMVKRPVAPLQLAPMLPLARLKLSRMPVAGKPLPPPLGVGVGVDGAAGVDVGVLVELLPMDWALKLS